MIIIDFIKVYQKIAEDVSLIIDNRLKKIERDFTFKAKVIELSTPDKYKIIYKNHYYTARCTTALNSGDIVYVCAPANNWSELFINLSASQAGKTEGYDDSGLKALIQRCIDDINNLKSSFISKILVNGNESPKSNNQIHLTIPQKTSDLVNDSSFVRTNELQDAIGNKVNRYGDTITGHMQFEKPTWMWFCNGGSANISKPGYLRLAQLTVNQAYNNAPIQMEFLRRCDNASTNIIIQFEDSATTDPAIALFQYYGSSETDLYMLRTAAGVWDLYVLKKNDWENMTVIDIKYTMEYGGNNFTIEKSDGHLGAMPSGAVKAAIRPIPAVQAGDIIAALQGKQVLNTCSGNAGEDGYVRVMGIQVNTAYADRQIQFTILQRQLRRATVVSLVFTGNTDSDIDNTAIQTICYEGDPSTIVAVRESPRQFGIYVQKVHSWDEIDIINLQLPQYLMNGLTFTYTNTQVSSQPSGSVAHPIIANDFYINNAGYYASARLTHDLNARLTALEQRMSS